jgi:hypothetical protein
MLRQTERERTILSTFPALAAGMIGEYDGYGIVGEDNTFRGPSPSGYLISTRLEKLGVVVLRIQRRDLPWRREISIAPNSSWKESTNGAPVEQSSAHFLSAQGAIIKRFFDDIRG